MSDMLRITGLATGLDVDSTVKQMMKAQNLRLDKVKQDRQIVQWKQDILRDVIGDINTLKSTYLDVTKPDSYVLTENNYSSFDISSSNSTIATAAAGAGTQAGIYTVSFTQDGTHLAQGAGVRSSAAVTTVSGDNAIKAMTLSELGVPGGNYTMSVTYNNNDGRGSITKTVDLTQFSTLSDMENAITSATSGSVIGRFSELTGEFSIQTSSTGANTSLSINGDASLLSKLKLYSGSDIGSVAVDDSSAGIGITPQNAVVYITPPGGSPVRVERSKNSFTVDGVTYNLLATSDVDANKTATLTITSNPQKTYDKIKAFIDKYNEVINEIQTEITEKKQFSFKPLTDEQKKDMKEDEIKKWEDKAKEGILKSDTNLQNMLYSLRKVFYDKVEDAGISLSDIGISTDSNYSNGGKILIDETKLKDTIRNNGSQVARIFMKNSSISYDPDHKTDGDRYKEIGIFQRIDDIFKDYVRTSRDSDGRKGILIERAGVKGDISEFINTISKDLEDNYDDRIKELQRKLSDREERYYNQFAQLEKAIQRMNSQSSWLSQQFGGGGSQ